MTTMEEFALCWNNFTDNIASGFSSLLYRGDLCDVTLAVDGKLLKAHKIVLSICSPYFQKMFIENPCQHPIIILKDMSSKLVSNLLEFMYQGSVNVKQVELQAFMKIAETLQIKGLTTSSKKSKSENSSSTKPEESESTTATKRSLGSDEATPPKLKSQKSEPPDEDVQDLTNDDDIEAQSNEDLLMAVPEISMIESRMDTNSTKSRESTDGQNSSTSLRISSSQTLNVFSPFDYQNEPIQLMESTNKPNSILDIPISSGSGSNITMLSSTSLLHGNCIFNRNNTVATQQGLKTYWLCKSYRISMCKARCITHQGKVISATGVHNHLPHMNSKQDIPPGHTPNICNPPMSEFSSMPSGSSSSSSHNMHNNPAQHLMMPQPYHPYMHHGISQQQHENHHQEQNLRLPVMQISPQTSHENKITFNSSESGNLAAPQLKFEHI
ncbi:unnamed protein product [Chironomus riparius]|uniref:BTB domain-containing protein n=1 Tax=Chironomus riparius TaxID=315576 RepID=A0A9N9WQJ2_9DIPT|nr:unnamed protein product [Chironomus riparius]